MLDCVQKLFVLDLVLDSAFAHLLPLDPTRASKLDFLVVKLGQVGDEAGHRWMYGCEALIFKVFGKFKFKKPDIADERFRLRYSSAATASALSLSYSTNLAGTTAF